MLLHLASRGLEKPPRASPVFLPRQRSRRSSSVPSCSALPRGSHVVQSGAKRFGLGAASSPQSSSPSCSSLVPQASSSSRGDREEGAHSLPAYIHPPIPVEATVTHPHYHRDNKKKKNGPSSAPPEMMKNAHRPVLFLLYAAAATALASALPSTAAAVSLLSTVWLSFVLAISFTEAWVKFRAPTLAKSAAVDAGRHVFAALNSVEAGLAVGLVAALSSSSSSSLLDAWRRIAAAPLAALALQVGWLTPSLDRRARELIVSSWRKKKKETRNEEDDQEDKEKEERARAAVLEMEARDAGTPVPPAWLHAVYVALEAVKVVSLALLVKSAGRGAFVF